MTPAEVMVMMNMLLDHWDCIGVTIGTDTATDCRTGITVSSSGAVRTNVAARVAMTEMISGNPSERLTIARSSGTAVTSGAGIVPRNTGVTRNIVLMVLVLVTGSRVIVLTESGDMRTGGCPNRVRVLGTGKMGLMFANSAPSDVGVRVGLIELVGVDTFGFEIAFDDFVGIFIILPTVLYQ